MLRWVEAARLEEVAALAQVAAGDEGMEHDEAECFIVCVEGGFDERLDGCCLLAQRKRVGIPGASASAR